MTSDAKQRSMVTPGKFRNRKAIFIHRPTFFVGHAKVYSCSVCSTPWISIARMIYQSM